MNDQSVGEKTALCPRCGTTARLRPRVFSDQALTALVSWAELESRAVGQHLCDGCYNELREVLIDREDELAAQVPSNGTRRSNPAAQTPAVAKDGHDKESAKGGKGRGMKIAG